jgi:hypothetical protein
MSQIPQMISTRVSLIILSLGFSIFGMLIIVNQHQAELNDLSGSRSFAIFGGTAALLVGTAFLVAACLYRKFAYFGREIDWRGAYPGIGGNLGAACQTDGA